MKVITLTNNNVMHLKRKVAVLRKMMTLKIVKRMKEALKEVSKKLHDTWCCHSQSIKESEIVGK